MKIELNFNNDTLVACNQLLQEIYNESQPTTEAGKLVKSIALDVADKLDSKCKTIVKKASLFDNKKKHKITLKYHEAWGMYRSLIELNENTSNEFKRTVIQNVISVLNQKLA